MLSRLIDLSGDIGIADIVDVIVVAVLIYWVFRGLVRSKGALTLLGLGIVSALYLLARLVGLNLVTLIFEGFFTVIVVALLIIFQDEVKRFFEQVAVRSLRARQGRVPVPARPAEVDILVRTLSDLARDRVGALVVLPGRENLSRHLQGGVELQGKLSEALLKSLFDPHSIGHDGAAVVSGNTIVRFSCRLPLSENEAELAGRGTRHAAALGLSERADALCLVVSEESGSISAASSGHIEKVADSARLTHVIEEFLAGTVGTATPDTPKRARFRRDLLLRIGALAIAAGLWFLFVHESTIEYRSYSVAVERTGLPENLVVQSVQPTRVVVTVSGPRRAFYLVTDRSFTAVAKLFNATAGTLEVGISPAELDLPDGLTFVNVTPRSVVFVLQERQQEQ